MNHSHNVTVDYKTHFLQAAFHYMPSTDLAIADTILYAAISVGMLVSILRSSHRPRYIWILFVCACLETIGYGARVECTGSGALSTFIVQAVLILVVPIAIALVNYIVVGILLEAGGKQVYCLTPKRVARVFFASDVGAFFLQAIGASMMANEASADSGQNLALIGVVVQLGFFTMFVFLILYIAFGNGFRMYAMAEFKPVFHALCLTSILMYLRNIYRTIEFLDRHGYVASNEWVFSVFDTFAILVCFLAYSFWNFGQLLPGTEAELAAIVAKYQGGDKDVEMCVEAQGAQVLASGKSGVLREHGRTGRPPLSI
eukprot:CAMPEP_0113703864 /NCGR_PEP_ID=MMETSP0038_2-20120614/26143_1 /TAXON_ID=2898 /ORGANISM="Cryptomonas paramecium" /LENGTH=314 /DNA_ID=CAMNT_0000628467 /DNA_START=107 /DNA_END=1051 /DNA_ORIENTATION=+ /assembly_acc=CAM_ASM_000170